MSEENEIAFTTKVDNPKYRYGDLHRNPSLTVLGCGKIVHWHEEEAIIRANNGKFYSAHFSALWVPNTEIKTTEVDEARNHL